MAGEAEVETEVVVEEAEVVVDDAQALAEFNSGFSETKETPTEVDTPTPVVTDESKPAETVETKVEDKVEPVLTELTPATITAEQLNTLLVKARQTDELTAKLSKFQDDTAGRIGGLEQTLKALRESTPAGEPVTVTVEDLVEFTKEFPDLAPKLAKDLTAVFAKKGTVRKVVETAPAPVIDVKKEVESIVALKQIEMTQKLATEHLAELYGENWQTITGDKDSKTAYRLWLNTQPEAYQTKILTSNSGPQIAGSIEKFKDFEKAEAAKKVVKPPVQVQTSTRSKRLSEAVPPRTGAPASRSEAKTDQEQFLSGFNS